MNILVMYATNSGSTHFAAEHVAKHLSLNHQVKVQKALDINLADFSNYDHIILMSNSWFYEGKEGQPHIWFIEKRKDFESHSFPDKDFSIIGLGDRSYEHFCGAVDELEGYVKKMNGSLNNRMLRIDTYLSNEEQNNQAISDWLDANFS